MDHQKQAVAVAVVEWLAREAATMTAAGLTDQAEALEMAGLSIKLTFEVDVDDASTLTGPWVSNLPPLPPSLPPPCPIRTAFSHSLVHVLHPQCPLPCRI